MELKDSQTFKNLQAAFAGESQAHTKYQYFASQAKKDGYVQIQNIFLETSKNEKLCPKCTALLATVMTKLSRCQYGITKPICDRCENQCFGAAQNKEFMKIMQSASTGMFLRHPMMAIKHKMASMSFDYSMHEQEKAQQKKAEAKAKNAEAKLKARQEQKKDK